MSRRDKGKSWISAIRMSDYEDSAIYLVGLYPTRAMADSAADEILAEIRDLYVRYSSPTAWDACLCYSEFKELSKEIGKICGGGRPFLRGLEAWKKCVKAVEGKMTQIDEDSI